MQEVTRHLAHYFSLFGIMGVALWGLTNFSYDQVFQSAIAVSLGGSFVVWGLVHHHIHEDLHLGVVLEYVASALFGVIVLLAIIWR